MGRDCRAGYGRKDRDGVAIVSSERTFAADGLEHAGVGVYGGVGHYDGEIDEPEDIAERVIFTQAGGAEYSDMEGI